MKALLLTLAIFTSEIVIGASDLPLEELQKLESQIQQVHLATQDAIVAIKIDYALGSGTIISPEGHILTCYHVVEELDQKQNASGATSTNQTAFVILSDGREYPAKLLGCNRNIDAAVMQIINPPTNLAYSKLSDGLSVSSQDWVIAAGHSTGFKSTRPAPIRLGTILTEDFESAFLETDCTIIAGDSGGPLFNLQGEIIGVNSFIGEDLRYNRHSSARTIHQNIDDMIKGRRWGSLDIYLRVDEPFIGIVNRASSYGSLITEIAQGSPADKAALLPGDIITHINDERIISPNELKYYITQKPIGTTFQVSFIRDKRKKSTSLQTVRRTDIYYQQ